MSVHKFTNKHVHKMNVTLIDESLVERAIIRKVSPHSNASASCVFAIPRDLHGAQKTQNRQIDETLRLKSFGQ